MRKTLIIAAALAAMAGPAMAAAEKTFDEMYPAKPSVEEWCTSKATQAGRAKDDPAVIGGVNRCIDNMQMHHDYAKMSWSVLRPERKGACTARWLSQRGARIDYDRLSACFESQLQAQDREEIHSLVED
jgi:hypothetical protein